MRQLDKKSNLKDHSPTFVGRNRFSDIAGVCLSALCITHCVVAPILLAPFMLGAMLPRDRFTFLQEGTIHDIMFVLTLVFGISSVYFAARQGKHLPVICLTVGLVAVSSAEFFLHDLAVVRLPGTLCVIGGHLWAMRNSVISRALL
ncbi:MAG TPA: MerC domain-containing protein [Chryseolinea sp.]|nr:MerC domain-containing protein [Chryseolinea sp.]